MHTFILDPKDLLTAITHYGFQSLIKANLTTIGSRLFDYGKYTSHHKTQHWQMESQLN